MRHFIGGLAVIAFAGLVSGCYVAPPYSYVRGTTYAGSAYYGEGPTVIYRGSYDAYPYTPYYGGYYGCCWSSGGVVRGGWQRGYGGHRYDRDDYRGRARGNGWRGNGHGHGHGDDGGRWHGRRDDRQDQDH
ncbi:MAG: hypothetical protein EPN56_01765 [Rhodanobacter sp.]|nr:MAG: hypothetical protein EPN78_03570 [Rhodanobacter sp.]TAM14537.1 MAG: hypothetical protein EPN66_01530 [Rhodanobacter sp.]TAM37328.1 MAG: hypothetical protein EPN56_01765 [Rhodanobacter sp.]